MGRHRLSRYPKSSLIGFGAARPRRPTGIEMGRSPSIHNLYPKNGQGGIAYASLRPSHFRSRCSHAKLGRHAPAAFKPCSSAALRKGFFIPPCPIGKTKPSTNLRSSIHDLTPKTDREGFEPSVTLPPHTLSKRAHSTTLTPALGRRETRGTGMAWQPILLKKRRENWHGSGV